MTAGAILVVLLLGVAACSASDGAEPPAVAVAPTSDAAATTVAKPPTTVAAPRTTVAGESTVSAVTASAAAAPCTPAGTIAHHDLPYRALEGVAPHLLSLDLYQPDVAAGCPAGPIVVFVHGGGFSEGDKRGNVDDKARAFNDLGWVFASVNYRLAPRPPALDDPDRVRYPAQNEDVAAALAWLGANGAAYGGDPSRIALTGHSAGAFLVAVHATSPELSAAAGFDHDHLRCTVPLDTGGFSVAAAIEGGGRQAALYRNAFGDDPAVWAQASPIERVAAGVRPAPFLVVVQGRPGRVAANQAFVDALTAAGVAATLLDADPLSHAEVNDAVGRPDDRIVTPPLIEFLAACLGA